MFNKIKQKTFWIFEAGTNKLLKQLIIKIVSGKFSVDS